MLNDFVWNNFSFRHLCETCKKVTINTCGVTELNVVFGEDLGIIGMDNVVMCDSYKSHSDD